MEKLKVNEKCKNKLNQLIVQNFFNDEDNYVLFRKALKNPKDTETKKKLDTAFQQYYKSIKILGYMSRLIYYYSIDFDKKINRYKSKEVYAKENESSSDSQKLLDTYFSSKEDLTFDDFQNHQSLLDQIENEVLYENLKSLKKIQLKVLELIYIQGLNNKETASVLGESEQTVSYNHKTALKKLKNNVKGMINDG